MMYYLVSLLTVNSSGFRASAQCLNCTQKMCDSHNRPILYENLIVSICTSPFCIQGPLSTIQHPWPTVDHLNWMSEGQQLYIGSHCSHYIVVKLDLMALARHRWVNPTVTETPQRTRLKSRRPLAIQVQELLHTTPADTSWVKARWRDQWKAAEPSRLHKYIEDPTDVPGQNLPLEEWTTLNCLRTGVRRFSASMQKWGLTDSAHCLWDVGIHYRLWNTWWSAAPNTGHRMVIVA